MNLVSIKYKGQIMKYIKEYLCYARIPSDEEIRECLEIVQKEDCVIRLIYNGHCKLHITSKMTFEECKSKLPKFYGV